MENSFVTALETVHAGVGQGGVLEQIDKRYRRQQRLTLFEMLEAVSSLDVENFPVIFYKHIPQNGKKEPALLRFSLPLWKSNVRKGWTLWPSTLPSTGRY